MSAAFDETNHEAPPQDVPASGRAPRRVARLDLAARTITVPDENGDSTYDVGALPVVARDWCVMQGAWNFMRVSKNPDATFARLVAGDLPRQRTGEKAPKKPDTWRLAYAHALVEGTKKTDAPLTFDEATERARALDRSSLASAKLHPRVLHHYHRLNGGVPNLV
jgi:hypothetical protein